MWRLLRVLDAQLGLLHHVLEGGADEVCELAPFSHDHRPSTGLSSGAWAGSRATTSQCRWVFNQACMARLRWAGRPSHNSVAFPPRKRRSSGQGCRGRLGVVREAKRKGEQNGTCHRVPPASP